MNNTKENDQLNAVEEEIAGPLPEIPLEHDQILKGGGRFWDDVNGEYLPEDIVFAMLECKDKGMKLADLIFVDTDTSVRDRKTQQLNISGEE